jgi:hypothetical protein
MLNEKALASTIGIYTVDAVKFIESPSRFGMGWGGAWFSLNERKIEDLMRCMRCKGGSMSPSSDDNLITVEIDDVYDGVLSMRATGPLFGDTVVHMSDAECKKLSAALWTRWGQYQIVKREWESKYKLRPRIKPKEEWDV